MTRWRSIGVALAVAGAAACSSPDDPCAFATPGAGWLAFSSAQDGSWDVQIIRADGTCRRAITSDAAFDGNPAWAPHGVLAYESDRGTQPGIWIHPMLGGAERQLDVGALVAASPAFSPDGTKLAFEAHPPGAIDNSIYVIPAAGGTPVELTPGTSSGNGGPVFSPDGVTSIYFVSNRNGPYDVFAVPVGGGAAVQVTTGSGIIGKPSVSPDGRTLAFTRPAGASTEVVLYDLVGGTTTPLGIAGAAEPAFDPAGGRLAISVFYTGFATIDLAPPSGGTSTRLTLGPGPDGSAAFAPPP